MKELKAQLDGLAMAVQSDENFPANKEDYLVTVNSLKKRLDKANKMPDDPVMSGTKTGRTSSKNPNFGSIPRNMTPKQRDAANKAMNPPIHPPMTNRRAAIEHTRKLNESGNDS